MARLHVEYYNGREHYSEGDVVEQDILNYVSNYSEEEYPNIFEKDSRWTVFYHLTDIRRAILAWYPFEKKDSILEIGAGMGALTGLLCERCGKVCAVELTEIRAKTIYKRYENKDNLDIYIGNVLDMNFEEKYDYISLIGVLEYQGSYSDTVNPYVDFLKNIQRFLKPNGKILMAIENKFGIKYWCGVPEDHTGVVYDSINSYPEGGKAKTFSKRELVQILQEADIERYKFFYPMPDYKLPQVILSEGNLPNNKMPSRIIPYYLYYPTLIASEKTIYNELLENKVFDFFANSFLVECCISDSLLSDITMATITADRKPTHQMCTVIHNNDYVEKFPLKKEGIPLLQKSYDNILAMEKNGISVLSHKIDKLNANLITLSMPYCSDEALDTRLASLALAEKRDDFYVLFDEFYSDLLKSSSQVLADDNCLKKYDDGITVLHDFGPILKKGYIDMIPHNCFVTAQGERNYFDQEFCIDNLPAKFMVFRAIKNLYAFNACIENQISINEVKNHFNIEDHIWEIFEKQDRVYLEQLTFKGVSQVMCAFWYVDGDVYRKNAKLLMDFPQIQNRYNQELEILTNELNRLQKNEKDLESKLQNMLNSAINVKEQKQIEINKIKNELKNYKVIINQKNKELNELVYRLNGLSESKELFGRTKDKEIEGLHIQQKDLHNQFQNVNELANNYKKALEELENSTSWKITAPLRRTKDALIGRKKSQEEVHLSEVSPQIEIPDFDLLQQPKEKRPASESGISGRLLVEQLVSKLIKYDVISFDVFDTLLFRIYERPVDVFKLVGLKLELMSFYKLRVSAELEARDKTTKRNKEINIYDIYQYLEKYVRIDPEKTIQIELQTEKESLYANPYMQEVFNILKRNGKKLVFTSDMYWPNEKVTEMLAGCGYSGFDNGFVSCDFQCNKGSGQLQQIVAQNYRNQAIIHIGDNFLSDVRGSQLVGWDTFYYENCQTIGQRYRPTEHESIVASFYNGLVNNYMHNGLHVYSPSYEYGFLYGGLLVCGFCEWLNEFAKQNQIEQIMFLARDCEIIEKIYNKHYKAVDNVYVKVSRLAMWQVVFEDKTEEFIQNFFKIRAIRGNEEMGNVLKKTGLECLIKYLPLYNLEKEVLLTLETYECVRNMVYDKKKEIVATFSNATSAAKIYFKEIMKNNQRICAVDLGWSGQILLFLKHFIETHINHESHILGAYVAATTDETANISVGTQLLNTYIFSYSQNRDIRLKTNTIEGSMIAIFLEAMFSSTDPTLIQYDLDTSGNVKYVYGHHTGDAGHIKELHQGIMDFADLYNEKISLNHHFFKISGTEAFAPFNQISNDFSYNYEMFKDYKELSDSLPQIVNEEKCTTLGEIIKERNLL